MTEVELIEQTAMRVGMKSLMNNGAASCVYTEGCDGVSQEHLISFAREVALHCVVTLGSPASLASPSSGGCKEPPAPDQYRHFMTAYYKACQSSQPTDWLDAALMAKQWEQAITGGAFDAQYSAPKSGDKSHE